MIDDGQPRIGWRIDPTTGQLYLPSWATLQREALNLRLAHASHQIDVGRPMAVIAAELRRIADHADQVAAVLKGHDQIDLLEAMADELLVTAA